MSTSTPPSPLSFVLVDGSTRRTGIVTHTPFTVGRLPENDLVLSHPYVSRRHAEIVVEDGVCYVVDQNSRHGTFINGMQIKQQALQHGMTIKVGATELRFLTE